MNLAKTSLLNGLAAVLKLLTTLGLNKLLAVYVGPAGYAVIGQFQSFVAILGSLAGGALNTGVTKYIAQHHDRPERQSQIWQTALGIGLIASLLLGIFLITARDPLSEALLGTKTHSDVIVWLASSLPLLVTNGALLAIMNGRKATRHYVLANIIGSVLTAATAALLVVWQGLHGALIAVTFGQAIAFIATAWLFRRACDIQWSTLFGRIRRQAATNLGQFALMGLTSAIAVSVGQIVIREGLTRRFGLEFTGLWQAMWKISETQLMLLTTTLSAYFLPRFSEIQNGTELAAEVRRGYRFAIPVCVVISLLLFILREPLISLLLTKKFLPLQEALGYQLVGDILKVGSWVSAYTMLSHARTRLFISTELIFSGMLVCLILAGASLYGLPGAAIGYGLTYTIYWMTMHLACKNLCRNLSSPSDDLSQPSL